MKAYTDINQSKKLAEILPLESADMCFVNDGTSIKIDANPYNVRKVMWKDYVIEVIPCWSLTALLELIPYNVTFNKAVYRFKLVKFSDHWECYHENFGTVSIDVFKADNSIDACYEMIIKLHEQNIL